MIKWYKNKKEEIKKHLDELPEEQRKIAVKSFKKSMITTIFMIVLGITLTVLLIVSMV